ncbi:MAG: DUF2254 domain-containing protein [Propionibacteriaceae bacterium]|nr:DUF2254 domain-containing protein [Micropruina sp.]
MKLWDRLTEYASAALWVLPFLAGGAGILAFVTLARIEPGASDPLSALAFQGTASQARDLLMAITGTVVTVIALVLGLSVVALTTASAQYSPRLLRNFLRDRTNQVVLSIFLATFSFSASGLYVVDVSDTAAAFPRLAVSASIALLFASLGAVVIFSNHLSHSIQVDAIMVRVQHDSLATVRRLSRDAAPVIPIPPRWAVTIPARTSGYVVTAHRDELMTVAKRYGVSIALIHRVGEHVVVGRPLAQVWMPTADTPPPDRATLAKALDDVVGIGFERTYQQDAAMGIRQLVDAACKALSPAVNDPYTAVQAVDHLTVIFDELAERPLGPVFSTSDGLTVVVPARRFEEYLGTMCGLIRRYCSAEPTVSLALLRLLDCCADAAKHDPERLRHIAKQAQLIVEDAQREVRQPQDFIPIADAADVLVYRIEASYHSEE